MLIIGEKLNSSIPSALAALKAGENEITGLLINQAEAGADYLDINTALFDNETDRLIDAVKLAVKHTDKGIMPDSPDMRVIAAALEFTEGRAVIINSVSLSTDTSPLKGLDLRNTGVVAMPTDDDGLPETPEKRLINTQRLVDKLTAIGFTCDNIYADILIETVAVNQSAAITAIDTLKLIKSKLPGIKTVCGASNISFGLPRRKFINSAFVALAVYHGVDAMITDILNPDIKAAILSAQVLKGEDEYCMNYLEEFRRL
ncbi:MAG: dihydropteroate synthase [Christensenellales bacterium]|jgi:cobalamin-dependent methionine synthase I